MYDNNQYIFYVMGLSSVGKDTIVNKLLEKNNKLTRLSTVTTRPKRSSEQNDIEYKFVSNDEFNNLYALNKLMEHRKYTMNAVDKDATLDVYYGLLLPEDDVQYSIAIGTYNAFIDISKSYGDKYHIVPIFISISDSERLFRMITREISLDNPNFREVVRRFFSDKDAYASIDFGLFSRTFVNINLEKCVNNINEYISSYMDFEDYRKNVTFSQTTTN